MTLIVKVFDMHTAIEVLEHLKNCEMAISLDGDEIIIHHEGRMTNELRALIREVKPKLVRHLKAMDVVLQEPEYFQDLAEHYLERSSIMTWCATDIYTDVRAANTAARIDTMRVYTDFREAKPNYTTQTMPKSNINTQPTHIQNTEEDK